MVRENKTECKMTFRNEEPHVNKCFPRVRGDVPRPPATRKRTAQFSPRARGCSVPCLACEFKPPVFPACAGMFRFRYRRLWRFQGFPRVRGDVPPRRLDGKRIYEFSPRARGCSPHQLRLVGFSSVFPACAGMFPAYTLLFFLIDCFPRVRGDVP